MNPPIVFLSAVTKDFGLSFLQALRTSIHDLGCVCKYRGNLRQGGVILPEKLRAEIEGADCVIHLVGPSFGYGPDDVEQPDLERTPAGEYWKSFCKAWWPFPDNFPARRSYTQMEYDFATELKRPVFVLFVDDPDIIAAAAGQPEEEARLQAQHRAAIKKHGHEYVKVDSAATITMIAEKLPIIVDHLKAQLSELTDFIGSIDDRLSIIQAAVTAPVTATPTIPFQLPPAASEYFGRSALVADLASRLRKNKRTDVWGGPGMGKTALASEAVTRIVGNAHEGLAASPFPDGIVFLNLYKIKEIDTAWQALANAFDDTLPTDMPARERVERACAKRRALIILEGAEVLETRLNTFIDVVAPESTLLVLTREEQQTAASRRLRLNDLLEEADALALLRHLTKDAPLPVAETVVRAVQSRLGGHPLALTWAGSQLADANQPANHFLRDLQAQTFTKLTEPGGDPGHTLKWMFDRSVRLMAPTTRTVLAAVSRISEPFDESWAGAAGGQEADLQRLVQLAYLRVADESSGWQFAHALALQHAREMPLSGDLLAALGRHAIAKVNAADARCHIDRTAPLGAAIAHANALLSHDGTERLLDFVAKGLIYQDTQSGTVGIRRGRLDFALRAVESVRQWQERASAEDKKTSGWLRESYVTLFWLGYLAVTQGDLTGAAGRFEQTLAIAQRLAASDPGNAGGQRDLFVSLNKLGDLCTAQGDLTGASQRFEESLAIAERLAKSNPGNAGWQRDLSVSLEKLGGLCKAQGDLTGASQRFEQSLAIFERLAKSDPGNAGWQFDVGISNERLGDVAQAQGRLDDAKRYYTAKFDVISRLAKSDPGNAEWQRDLSVSLNKLGDLCVAQGDLSGGSQRFEESLAIAERLAKSDPGNAGWQRDLSVSLNKLGDLCVAQGDLSGGSQRFEQSLAIRERLAKSDPGNAEWQRDVWVSCWRMASLAEKQNKPEEAKGWWRKAYETLSGMKLRGLHVSPEDLGFLARLEQRIG